MSIPDTPAPLTLATLSKEPGFTTFAAYQLALALPIREAFALDLSDPLLPK